MAGNDPKGPDRKSDREPRSYPHGTGDRNAWSHSDKDPMPIHEGGTQRQAPPAPEPEPEPDKRSHP